MSVEKNIYKPDEVCKKIHPVKYLKDHLELGIRPADSRKPFSYRSVAGEINILSKCCGSSIVKIGNTTLICGIQHQVTTPSKVSQSKGLIDINCKLSEHCNIHHLYRNKVVQLKQCINLLQKLFIGLKIIDLESLCISKSELVWFLKVHIICVDYDGGYWDAAVLAMYLALKSVKLPKVEYDLDSKSFRMDETTSKMLPIGQFPLATTFGIFQNFVFADPTREEEELCTSYIVIVVENEDIRIIQKRGGTPISEKDLNHCIELAKKRYNIVKTMIDVSCEESNTSKKKSKNKMKKEK